jgi:TolB-like protein/thioredoxin-like negative regulator of GroEL
MSEPDPWSDTGRFLAEMRRRHVVRFSIAYAAAAFVVLQLAEIVFPAFGVGERELRFLVVAVALGFIPAVVLAWIYDVTKDGIRRTTGPTEKPAPKVITLVAFALTTIGVSAGVGWYIVSQDALSPGDVVATQGVPATAQSIRSLAVLPLDDFSAEGGQEYIAAGMHDEIIAKLSMLDGVRVVSRTTSMRYSNTMLSSPEIGRELGVDALIEGSVNRSGDQVRITLQIIHAESDTHLGTLQFDRGVDDLLALQTDVAQAVAAEIGGTYEEADISTVASVSPAAQDAYLRGKFEYDRNTSEGYQQALELFQQAVDSVPDYADAMAGLAGARFLLALEDPQSRRAELEQARTEAEAALAMDSTSLVVRDLYDVIRRGLFQLRRSEARASGTTLARGNGGPGVRSGLPNVVAIDQAVIDTTWVAAMTTFAQRIEEGVRPSVIEGSGVTGQTTEGRLFMAQGRYAEAAQLLQEVVTNEPETPIAWDQLLRSYAALGEPMRAADVVESWSASGAEGAPSPDLAAELRRAVDLEGMRGYWTWRRDLLTDDPAAPAEVSQTELAAAEAALGNRDRAYELLEVALQNSETRLLAVPNDPTWDPLRGDPRFRAIERRIQRARFDTSLRILAGRSAAPAIPAPSN